MQIRKIRATEVRVEFRDGWTDSEEFGRGEWEKTPKWIIEVEFDNGVRGLGESPRGVGREAVEHLAHQLAGKRLAEINLKQPALPKGGNAYALPPENSISRGDLWEYVPRDTTAWCAFEMACRDAMGKAAGLPLASLFGGAWRDRVPMAFWIGRLNPRDAAAQTRRAVEWGFRSMKMKAFFQDDIAAVVGAIREAAGFPIPITIDPNLKFYRFAQALEVDRTLRDFTGITYEDPFPYHPVEWQEFRRRTGRQLIWHANKDGSRADPIKAAMDGACDGLNISYDSADEIFRDAGIASQFGMIHWQGTGLDLGIYDAFRLQTSAACRTAVLPGDAVGHLLRKDDLIEESLVPIEGNIPLPKGAGPGSVA